MKGTELLPVLERSGTLFTVCCRHCFSEEQTRAQTPQLAAQNLFVLGWRATNRATCFNCNSRDLHGAYVTKKICSKKRESCKSKTR